jgi:hypothetical protein
MEYAHKKSKINGTFLCRASDVVVPYLWSVNSSENSTRECVH